MKETRRKCSARAPKTAPATITAICFHQWRWVTSIGTPRWWGDPHGLQKFRQVGKLALCRRSGGIGRTPTLGRTEPIDRGLADGRNRRETVSRPAPAKGQLATRLSRSRRVLRTAGMREIAARARGAF